MNLPNEPTLLQGGCSVDDRGSLQFLNDFPLGNFKRFYTVSNHSRGFIRAWHGHLFESKTFFIIKGAAIVCAVKLTDEHAPDRNQEVKRVVLNAGMPSGFYIPAGYANGFMSLTNDAILIVFSDKSLSESLDDDYRFPFDYWNPWEIIPR